MATGAVRERDTVLLGKNAVAGDGKMDDVHVHLVGDVEILKARRDCQGHRRGAAGANLRSTGTNRAGLRIDGVGFDLTVRARTAAAA